MGSQTGEGFSASKSRDYKNLSGENESELNLKRNFTMGSTERHKAKAQTCGGRGEKN